MSGSSRLSLLSAREALSRISLSYFGMGQQPSNVPVLISSLFSGIS